MRSSRQDRRKQEQEERDQEYQKVLELKTVNRPIVTKGDVTTSSRGLLSLPVASRALVPVAVKPPDRQTEFAVTSAEQTTAVILPEAVSSHRSDGVTAKPSNRVIFWFLLCLAGSQFLVTLCQNALVAYDRGSTFQDKIIMSSQGAIPEAFLFVLPTVASLLWMQRHWLLSIFAYTLSIFLFVYALNSSLAFASINLTETMTAKSERITPAVDASQRRLDTLSASRRDECLKRGDRCRQLEKEEQSAFDSLKNARREVATLADPQITLGAKLTAWMLNWFSLTRLPSADDFANLRLLFLVVLPQLGGPVLMLAFALRS